MFCCGGTKIELNKNSLNTLRSNETLNNIKMKINHYDFEFNTTNSLWSSKFLLLTS